MDPNFSTRLNRPGGSQTHRQSGRSVPNKRYLHSTIGLIVRTTTIIAIICLVCWWEQGSTPSANNVLGTPPDRIMALASSPDGRWLASGGYHGSVAILDMTRKRIEKVLEGKDGPVFGLAFSPNGSILAAAGFDGTMALWDTRSWERQKQFPADSGGLMCLAFSPDGSLLATGGSDSTITLWDTASWRAFRLLLGNERPVANVRFSPDGRTLAASGSDETVKLWNVASTQPMRDLRPHFPGHGIAVHCVAFSPDSQLLATFGFRNPSRSLGPGKRETTRDVGRSRTTGLQPDILTRWPIARGWHEQRRDRTLGHRLGAATLGPARSFWRRPRLGVCSGRSDPGLRKR